MLTVGSGGTRAGGVGTFAALDGDATLPSVARLPYSLSKRGIAPMKDRTAQGVVLVSHGTVERSGSADDMRAFLQRIRHGRPASDELVAQMVQRYASIGGSPLVAHTAAQARALEERMGVPVFVSTRFGEPTLLDGLEAAAKRGIERLCVLPLAPFSVRVYADAFASAVAAFERGGSTAPTWVTVEPWGTEEAFVRTHADAISTVARTLLGEAVPALILTAHSLPTRVIAAGDGYQREVEACARAILTRCAWQYAATLAYQSQGADGGDWLGPDLRVALGEVARTGARDVIIAPFGFLAEHVETLYDLDIEAADWCRELGLTLHRVPALNTTPGLIEALAAVAGRALG